MVCTCETDLLTKILLHVLQGMVEGMDTEILEVRRGHLICHATKSGSVYTLQGLKHIPSCKHGMNGEVMNNH